jgi:hypothetical protein
MKMDITARSWIEAGTALFAELRGNCFIADLRGIGGAAELPRINRNGK